MHLTNIKIIRIIPLMLLMAYTACVSQAKKIHIKKFVPLQEQFMTPNATYLITCDINLRGDTIIIPDNSKLRFEKRGILFNGTIQGNNTLIIGCPTFKDIRLNGSFANKDYYVSWCSPESVSNYIEDVMNISDETNLIVDCDITLNDQIREVKHLSLKGENTTITNSDRFYVTYGGTEVSNLKFRWSKPPVDIPKDNYSAVIVYHDILDKDTTVVIRIENVDADGGEYCSYFMRQYKSSIQPNLLSDVTISNCGFRKFTRGAISTCGGSGRIAQCQFRDIGYDKIQSLWSVTALRLGYNTKTRKARAVGYEVEDCVFSNLVAAYNPENDGRELHGLLAYGDSIVVRNNKFLTLSTSFTEPTDTGMDSEMLYIKGSYNTIENNIFENGAGSVSDGVVTLKVGDTERNVLRNNQFLSTNTSCKFVYLGGRDHIVEGNSFTSIFSDSVVRKAYAIYLGHRKQEGNRESVVFRDNTFSFTGESNYMAIYANHWGDITLTNNTFHNPTKLIKCNKRNGVIVMKGNVVTSDNNVCGSAEDCFIEMVGCEKYSAEITNNDFGFTNAVMGILVKGSNYRFCDNRVTLNKSFLQALLRGRDTEIVAVNNTFSIDGNTHVSKNAIVGEDVSSKIIVERNLFEGRSIDQFLQKKQKTNK